MMIYCSTSELSFGDLIYKLARVGGTAMAIYVDTTDAYIQGNVCATPSSTLPQTIKT